MRTGSDSTAAPQSIESHAVPRTISRSGPLHRPTARHSPPNPRAAHEIGIIPPHRRKRLPRSPYAPLPDRPTHRFDSRHHRNIHVNDHRDHRVAEAHS
ncbi:hypothetical protein BVI2075_100001 [Burkholderia vietnamiensis]|nr:hypothetical protein BVI2075_100001 [Burkholderia vietnamiensis]